jgi:hypothetical protein
MRRLLVAVAVAAATGAVAAGAGSKPYVAPQARAARSCGTFRSSGHVLGVTVTRGNTSCTEARKVLGTFVSGKSTLHPAGRNTYWTVGSWRCLPTAKGGACMRGGTNSRTAREYVEANIK